MNSRAKLFFRYFILYPACNVVAMGVGAAILYFFLNWDVEYAVAFFKVSSVFLVFLFYILNIKAILSLIFNARR